MVGRKLENAAHTGADTVDDQIVDHRVDVPGGKPKVNQICHPLDPQFHETGKGAADETEGHDEDQGHDA